MVLVERSLVSQLEKAIPVIQEDCKARLREKVKELRNPYFNMRGLDWDDYLKCSSFNEAYQAILKLIEEIE